MLFDIGWSELLLIGCRAGLHRPEGSAACAARRRLLVSQGAKPVARVSEQRRPDDPRSRAGRDARAAQKATEFDIEKEFQKTVDPTGELAESIKPREFPIISRPRRPPSRAGVGRDAGE